MAYDLTQIPFENLRRESVTIFDPPSGWRYGFPKELPLNLLDEFETDEEYDHHLKVWLREQGYPEFLMEVAVRYSRYWMEDKYV